MDIKMKMKKVLVYTSFIILCVFSLLGRQGFAYPTPVDFDGSLLRWDISKESPDVSYEVVLKDIDEMSFYANIVGQAANIWNDVPTSYFNFVPVNEAEKAKVTIELTSSINDPNAAGYALFDEMDSKSHPLHCQIVVAVDDSYSYESLGKTFLHEMGHCAGLGHSLIPEAVMSYYLEENQFELDTDDRAAISRLYPIDGSNPKLPPGCSIGNYLHKAGRHSPDLMYLITIVFIMFPLLVTFFSVHVSRFLTNHVKRFHTK